MSEGSGIALFAADLVLLLHVLFVVFVVLGLLLVLLGGVLSWSWVRNPWLRLVHLVCIGIVVLQAWFGMICPLTTLEMMLREQAGEATYAGGFIAHWLEAALYYTAPGWVFALAYTLFGALVLASWFLVRPRRFGEKAMKRSTSLRALCLAIVVAGAATEDAVAAESGALVQQLGKVMASGQLRSASLSTDEYTYTVRLVLDVDSFNAREAAIVAANRAKPAADRPPSAGANSGRSSFFTAVDITDLRGTTLWWPCGKRTIGARLPGGPVGEVTQFDKDNRVSVWLLNRDGTQIMPAEYRCTAEADSVDVVYRFFVAEGERAVAVAVRLDNEYHIEPLTRSQWSALPTSQ